MNGPAQDPAAIAPLAQRRGLTSIPPQTAFPHTMSDTQSDSESFGSREAMRSLLSQIALHQQSGDAFHDEDIVLPPNVRLSRRVRSPWDMHSAKLGKTACQNASRAPLRALLFLFHYLFCVTG